MYIPGWEFGAPPLNDQLGSSVSWLRAVFHHPCSFSPLVHFGVPPLMHELSWLWAFTHTLFFFVRILFSPPFHLWTLTHTLGLSVDTLPLPSPSWPSKLWLGAHLVYPHSHLYLTSHSTRSAIEYLLRCYDHWPENSLKMERVPVLWLLSFQCLGQPRGI